MRSAQIDALSIADVASRLGISLATAYRAARAGEIPALRFGNRYVVPRPAFEEMLRTGHHKADIER